MSNIEESIRRAMEEGKFDDLPGKGKPLNLEDDTLTDPEWRLAHHMLRSSGFTLPWIERRQEIERRVEEAQRSLKRTWIWRQEALSRPALRPEDPGPTSPEPDPAGIETEWHKAVDQFMERVKAINQDIRSYNLGVPSGRFQLRPVNGQRELDLISSGASGTLQDTNPGL